VIEAVFLDIDGVLTDGYVYVDASGNELKRISFEDIDAFFELKREKIKTGFITGENSKFCNYVRKRFNPDFFLEGCKDKLNAFQELVSKNGLDKEKICYVGDSRKDIKLLEFLEISFAPSDSEERVRKAARFVLRAKRGQGVVKEVTEFVLTKQNDILL
jgi:3-deoxy-D-manno-octulosonate 8-phosphate phosphatase (KDO 8-P phosphatase)